MIEKFCLGIDVDKRTFKVCLMVRSEVKKVVGSRSFPNTFKGFNELVLWVSKKSKGHKVIYVMESTGVYHEHLCYHLYNADYSVHVVLPLKSKRYLQSLGLRSKNDQLDAKGLAMMGLEQDLEAWVPGSKRLLELRSLTRQLEILQNHCTVFGNQLEAAKHSAVMHKDVLKSLEELIYQTEKQITKLEKELERVVMNDKFLKEKYELLTSIKGVGILTFAVVATETNGFSLFKNQRQLVCYAGYDVLENQSGRRVGKTRISKKGNTHIRRILHLAAWSVVRHKTGPFYQLYERVYERTGIKMKAYVAVQRKLLVMLYTLWKKNEQFDAEFGGSDPQVSKLQSSANAQGMKKETASTKKEAALDGLSDNQLPKALFSES